MIGTDRCGIDLALCRHVVGSGSSIGRFSLGLDGSPWNRSFLQGVLKWVGPLHVGGSRYYTL